MKRLFVGNLPYQASEVDLQHWFTSAGVNTDTVSIVRDRFSGESRGFGFVDIANDEEADRTIGALNGQDFQGRTLVVNEARPVREGGGGGGAYEGGSRGGQRASSGSGRRDRY